MEQLQNQKGTQSALTIAPFWPNCLHRWKHFTHFVPNVFLLFLFQHNNSMWKNRSQIVVLALVRWSCAGARAGVGRAVSSSDDRRGPYGGREARRTVAG